MKILIVSHNPMSTYNGMGKTIYTFFRHLSLRNCVSSTFFLHIPMWISVNHITELLTKIF